MIPSAFADGAIAVTLRTHDGVVSAVDIANHRPTAVRLLKGRGAAEAVALLPTFYALCRAAQMQAGLAAVEQAAGLRPSAQHERARRVLLLAETILEHGMRALIDWPMLLGDAPVAEAARGLRGLLPDLPRRLFPHGDLPGGGLLSVDRKALCQSFEQVAKLIEQHVFGWPSAAALSDVAGWCEGSTTAAARLVRMVRRDGLEELGRSDIRPMPAVQARTLDARLAEDDDGFYASRPDLGGVVYETGPLARRIAHPTVAPLVQAHGNGLLPRLVARLVEIDLALREMRDLAADLEDAPPHAPLAPVTATGLGSAEAVRGLLVHRCELEEGRVKRWQILAPTEWNFHPQGPLARGLVGLPVAHAEEKARLVVAALDPCVACQMTVE